MFNRMKFNTSSFNYSNAEISKPLSDDYFLLLSDGADQVNNIAVSEELSILMTLDNSQSIFHQRYDDITIVIIDFVESLEIVNADSVVIQLVEGIEQLINTSGNDPPTISLMDTNNIEVIVAVTDDYSLLYDAIRAINVLLSEEYNVSAGVNSSIDKPVYTNDILTFGISDISSFFISHNTGDTFSADLSNSIDVLETLLIYPEDDYYITLYDVSSLSISVDDSLLPNINFNKTLLTSLIVNDSLPLTYTEHDEIGIDTNDEYSLTSFEQNCNYDRQINDALLFNLDKSIYSRQVSAVDAYSVTIDNLPFSSSTSELTDSLNYSFTDTCSPAKEVFVGDEYSAFISDKHSVIERFIHDSVSIAVETEKQLASEFDRIENINVYLTETVEYMAFKSISENLVLGLNRHISLEKPVSDSHNLSLNDKNCFERILLDNYLINLISSSNKSTRWKYKVDGKWTDLSEGYAKINGRWKLLLNIYQKQNTRWKKS